MYRDRITPLCLYTYAIANQGIGKGVLSNVIKCAAEIQKEHDEDYEIELEDWKEQKRNGILYNS